MPEPDQLLLWEGLSWAMCIKDEQYSEQSRATNYHNISQLEATLADVRCDEGAQVALSKMNMEVSWRVDMKNPRHILASCFHVT